MATFRRVFYPNSFVFLSVVTENRMPILVNNVGLLRKSFSEAKNIYSFEIYAICILPDHFHAILKPKNIQNYPRIVSAIKYNFSSKFNINKNHLSSSKRLKKEKGIWQRRYYEHTIRDEKDLNNHTDYIHYNPVKHKLSESVRDWKFSSFHKFVINEQYEPNWGCAVKDIISIQKMNLD